MTSIEKRVIWLLLFTLVLGIAALQYRNRVARPTLRVSHADLPAPTAPAKVNLNTADVAQLERLPGIGPALAQRILAYRIAHGRFRSIEELDQVEGIGPATLERLEPYLTVE